MNNNDFYYFLLLLVIYQDYCYVLTLLCYTTMYFVLELAILKYVMFRLYMIVMNLLDCSIVFLFRIKCSLKKIKPLLFINDGSGLGPDLKCKKGIFWVLWKITSFHFLKFVYCNPHDFDDWKDQMQTFSSLWRNILAYFINLLIALWNYQSHRKRPAPSTS